MNVFLTNDLRDFVRQKVTSGEFPSEEAVLQEAVRRFCQEDQNGCRADDAEKATLEDLIEYEAIESCARQVEGKDVPSIEEVRRMLSKIPGSMVQAVIEEREDRFQMPGYFFDTSALVKHYHTELGSPKVDLILGESGSDYSIARLTLAEVASVFAKKVRTGEITEADFDRLRLRFHADVRNRRVSPVRILNAHFESRL